jgi:hypothetical protein
MSYFTAIHELIQSFSYKSFHSEVKFAKKVVFKVVLLNARRYVDRMFRSDFLGASFYYHVWSNNAHYEVSEKKRETFSYPKYPVRTSFGVTAPTPIVQFTPLHRYFQ